MESGRTVNIDIIYLPWFAQDEGVWLNCYNDDNNTSCIVIEFHPIRMTPLSFTLSNNHHFTKVPINIKIIILVDDDMWRKYYEKTSSG